MCLPSFTVVYILLQFVITTVDKFHLWFRFYWYFPLISCKKYSNTFLLALYISVHRWIHVTTECTLNSHKWYYAIVLHQFLEIACFKDPSMFAAACVSCAESLLRPLMCVSPHIPAHYPQEGTRATSSSTSHRRRDEYPPNVSQGRAENFPGTYPILFVPHCLVIMSPWPHFIFDDLDKIK